MREFAKVSPKFWIGQTGRQMKQQGIETQLLALYLLTCPSSNMLGIYYLPISFIVHETGIPFEEASKSLQSLCTINFCSYDNEMEYIWVHEMAFYQIGGTLKPTDNRIKGIQDDYKNLPELSFLQNFYTKYHVLFFLEQARENRSSFKAPLQPLLSKEKETEKEIENEIERSLVQSTPCPIEFIFEHWKKTFQHPNAILDDKRKIIIRKALKSGYTLSQLCDAITGCSYTPHNLGHNDRGQRYDGLHIIFRDADQIDRFIQNYHTPPKPANAASALLQTNLIAGQNWLKQKLEEEQHDAAH